MDESQRQHYKELLLKHQKQAKHDIESLKERIKPIAPDSAIGRLSRMEAIQDKSMHEANLRRAKLRLEQLEYAIKHVETEDYGFCRNCGEPIPPKRLEILPETLLCMVCLKGGPDA